MQYSFHPEAEQEFFEAIEYYEACDPGLGKAFAREAYTTIQRVLVFPRAWHVLEGDVRRCLLNRFPYGILYGIETDGIFILAIMHLHRDPEYWKERC